MVMIERGGNIAVDSFFFSLSLLLHEQITGRFISFVCVSGELYFLFLPHRLALRCFCSSIYLP